MNPHSNARERQYDAKFLTGATSPGQFPPEDRPEIALAGRSNVGKSTLVNRLLNRRKLARVGATPGRTREINFFEIDGGWYCVDLPGYGYAQVGRELRWDWERLIGGYLERRRNLRAVLLLVDLRRGLGDLDRQMIALLESTGTAFQPVGTKSDKLGGNPRREAVRTLDREVASLARYAMGSVLPCSALDGNGLEPLRTLVESLVAPPPLAEEAAPEPTPPPTPLPVPE
ncbi:MAG: ribosome biogenesis GTP-binding protein YihA/YsxC [Magnetococcus sp. WYHC-3]